MVFDGPQGKLRSKCLLYLGDQWVPLSVVGKILKGEGFDVEASELKPEPEPEED